MATAAARTAGATFFTLAGAIVRCGAVASRSLNNWNTARQNALDQIEAAHVAVGGSAPGRRHATLQLNHAYTLLLAGQFQAFCRDLHSEAADHLANAVTVHPAVASLLRAELTSNRKLDRGNPAPGNLGADFGRFNLAFWPSAQALDRRVAKWQKGLERLTEFRNAIAHQDFTLLKPNLRLGSVRAWRRACRGLAKVFDSAVADAVHGLIGTRPW
jgi:hypothetical protein